MRFPAFFSKKNPLNKLGSDFDLRSNFDRRLENVGLLGAIGINLACWTGGVVALSAFITVMTKLGIVTTKVVDKGMDKAIEKVDTFNKKGLER